MIYRLVLGLLIFGAIIAGLFNSVGIRQFLGPEKTQEPLSSIAEEANPDMPDVLSLGGITKGEISLSGIIGKIINSNIVGNNFSSTTALDLTQVEKANISREMADLIETAGKNVSAPAPLEKTGTAGDARLTLAGVVNFTNSERVSNGMPALAINNKLNSAASAKLNDMISNGYFAHESPDGIGPADVVKASGYEFVAIAENLAVGDFKNDAELVEGWMNSPGHRANILTSSFKEIGVAVGKGLYQGRVTWFAVQEFGRPISACPTIDKSLLDKIKQNEAKMAVLEGEIQGLKTEMENLKSSGNIAEYNQKVPVYNETIKAYNALVEASKSLVAQYNGQVKAFNACAS